MSMKTCLFQNMNQCVHDNNIFNIVETCQYLSRMTENQDILIKKGCKSISCLRQGLLKNRLLLGLACLRASFTDSRNGASLMKMQCIITRWLQSIFNLSPGSVYCRTNPNDMYPERDFSKKDVLDAQDVRIFTQSARSITMTV